MSACTYLCLPISTYAHLYLTIPIFSLIQCKARWIYVSVAEEEESTGSDGEATERKKGTKMKWNFFFVLFFSLIQKKKSFSLLKFFSPSFEREKLYQQIEMWPSKLRPISMTYVPRFSTGGWISVRPPPVFLLVRRSVGLSVRFLSLFSIHKHLTININASIIDLCVLFPFFLPNFPLLSPSIFSFGQLLRRRRRRQWPAVT